MVDIDIDIRLARFGLELEGGSYICVCMYVCICIGTWIFKLMGVAGVGKKPCLS